MTTRLHGFGNALRLTNSPTSTSPLSEEATRSCLSTELFGRPKLVGLLGIQRRERTLPFEPILGRLEAAEQVDQHRGVEDRFAGTTSQLQKTAPRGAREASIRSNLCASGIGIGLGRAGRSPRDHVRTSCAYGMSEGAEKTIPFGRLFSRCLPKGGKEGTPDRRSAPGRFPRVAPFPSPKKKVARKVSFPRALVPYS